mmetsp:Transcript_65798/g.104183  ORF Transcript_65798/g.104183 Transcript_65798/m.104183 type:complete len:1549 (+) Transcript_65798:228-4874(+)
MDGGSRSGGCSRRLLELSMPRASRLAPDASSSSNSSSRRSTSASRRRGRWYEEFRAEVENTDGIPTCGSSRPSMWEPHAEYDQGLTVEVGRENLRVYPPTNFRAPPRSAELPDEELELEYVYGYSGNLHNHIHALDVNKVAYCAAAVAVVMDVQTNTQTIFRGHDQRVTCLAINREKELAATGQGELKSSGSCFCCIWRVADCSEVSRLHVAASRFDAIEWSQDGQLLFACTSRAVSEDALGQQERRYEESVNIWNYTAVGIPLVKTFILSEQVMGMRAHYSDCTRCAVYGAGHLTFFSYNPENADALRIWTPRWGASGPPQAVLCSVYMPVVGEEEDYSLVIGTSAGEIFVLQGEEVRMRVQHSTSPVTFLQSTPSSICCGGIDGRLCFLNPTSLKPFVYFEMRQAFSMLDSTEDANMCDAAVLVFILDGPRMTGSIVVGTDRNGLWLCNFVGSPQTLDVKPLTLFPGGKVCGLDSNPARSEEVAVATSHGVVRFFDAAEKTVDFRRPFVCDQDSCGGISCLAFDRAGLLLAIGCTFGRLLLISTPFSQPAEDGTRACNTQELTNTAVSEACVTALQWSSNVDWLVVGTADARVYLYCVAIDHVIDEAPDGPPRVEVQTVILSSPKVLDGNVSAVTSLQFSVNGDWVMSNSADNKILFWEMSTGRLEKSGHVVRDVVWYGQGESQDTDEDGSTIAQTSWRSPLGWPVAGLWPSSIHGNSRAAGNEVEREVLSVQSSPSSALCAFGDGLSRVSLVRFPAIGPDTKVKSYRGHCSSVTNVRWTSDDTMFSTAGDDGVMLQWRLTAAKCTSKVADCHPYSRSARTIVSRGQNSAQTAAALEAAIGKLKVQAPRKTPLQSRGSHASMPIPSSAYSQSSASASSFQRGHYKQQNPFEVPRSHGRNASLDRQNSNASLSSSRAPSPSRQSRSSIHAHSVTRNRPTSPPRNRPTSPRRATQETNSSRSQSPYPRSRSVMAGIHSFGQTKTPDSSRPPRKSGAMTCIPLSSPLDQSTDGRQFSTSDQPSSPRGSRSPGRSPSSSRRLSSTSPRRGAGQSQEHFTDAPRPVHMITRATQTEQRSTQTVSREDQAIDQPFRQGVQDILDAVTHTAESDESAATVDKGTATNTIVPLTKGQDDAHERRDVDSCDDLTASGGCRMPANIQIGGLARAAVIYAPESNGLASSACNSATVSTGDPSVTTVTSTNSHAVSSASGQAVDIIPRLEVTRSHSGPTVLHRRPSGTGSLLAAVATDAGAQHTPLQALLAGNSAFGGASSVPVPQVVKRCAPTSDKCHELAQPPQLSVRPGPSRLQRSSSGSATPLSARGVATQLQPAATQGIATARVIRSSLDSSVPPSARASLAAASHVLGTHIAQRSPTSTLETPFTSHTFAGQRVSSSERANPPTAIAPSTTQKTAARQVVVRPLVHITDARHTEDSATATAPPKMVARTPSEERLLQMYRGQRARAQGTLIDTELGRHGSASRSPSPTSYPVHSIGCSELIAADRRWSLTPRSTMQGAPRVTSHIGATQSVAHAATRALASAQSGSIGHIAQ